MPEFDGAQDIRCPQCGEQHLAEVDAGEMRYRAYTETQKVHLEKVVVAALAVAVVLVLCALAMLIWRHP